MPTVSVIIPVYKVEAYLCRCLDSVIGQTYSDWEAICVNDGSPDRCPEIIESYISRDSRFKIVNKENEGLYSAKNAGIEVAQGKYTVYLDSDDFLHPQTLEICVKMAERDGSDLVCYTYNHPYFTFNKMKHQLHIPGPEPAHFRKYRVDKIKSMVTDDIFLWASEVSYHGVCPNRRWLIKHCQAWRCLYRTDLIRDIKNIPIRAFEDFPWWSEILLSVRKATVINLPLYYYCHNATSLLNGSSYKRLVDSLRVAVKSTEELYEARADERQKALWTDHFLIPFKRILDHMEKRYIKACQKSQ